MAEGFVNALYSDYYQAFSAGIEPSGVNPYAIRVMAEINIDISGHQSKDVEQFLDQELDYVVTVCDHANETCPFFPGGNERLHKGFIDPAAIEGSEEEKTAGFRRVRDEIKEWIEESFGHAVQ
jgi:arsenate reductase